MRKISKEVDIEGTYFNITKAIYDKPTVSILLNGDKLKAFPLRSEQGTDVHSHQFIQLEILATIIREEKE